MPTALRRQGTGGLKEHGQQIVTRIPISCRLDSLAEPYYLFQKKGYVTEIASLKGGPAPIEPLSIEKPYNRLPLVKRFLNDGRPACRLLMWSVLHCAFHNSDCTGVLENWDSFSNACAAEALAQLNNTSPVAYITAQPYSAIFITGKTLDSICSRSPPVP